MSRRMTGEYGEVFRKMLEIREQRPELFKGNMPGVWYRVQKLLYLMRTGEVDLDNIEEYMDGKRLSDGEIPMQWYHKPERSVQVNVSASVKASMKLSNKKENMRGRITPRRLKILLHSILMRRVEEYGCEDSCQKKRILCLVGESGSGKTLASLHLQYKLGANVICSFTTRPPRETEVEGREHHFINLWVDPNDILAYAYFGGYEYYALKSQVFGPCTVYVIDEEGLRNLERNHSDKYEIYKVYIKRSDKNRQKSGISLNRRSRDKEREKFDDSYYDWIVDNNSTKKQFFVQIEEIYNKIKDMSDGSN